MKSLLHRPIRLDHLISHKSTGTPADCANKIGISERSLYDYLKILKEMGAPVRFSRDRRGDFGPKWFFVNFGGCVRRT